MLSVQLGLNLVALPEPFAVSAVALKLVHMFKTVTLLFVVLCCFAIVRNVLLFYFFFNETMCNVLQAAVRSLSPCEEWN